MLEPEGYEISMAPGSQIALQILEAKASTATPDAQFSLARALWSSPRERARARTLAESALATWKSQPQAARRVAEVEAWLNASVSK